MRFLKFVGVFNTVNAFSGWKKVSPYHRNDLWEGKECLVFVSPVSFQNCVTLRPVFVHKSINTMEFSFGGAWLKQRSWK